MVLNLRSVVKNLLIGISNFIYPPLCVACSQELESGLVCSKCISDLDSWQLGVCPRCGWPIKPKEHSHNCNWGLSLKRVRSIGLYATPLSELIHQLKYNNRRSLAKILGAKMGLTLNSDPILRQADFLVPIPLHPARKRDRGYNQSELLALAISQFSGMPMLDCLKRRRNTKSQTALSPEERFNNVKGAFAVNPGFDLRDKQIILVDDVLTSGATLDTAAQVLIKAGARVVYGLTAAWA